jgi:hypothetical protein
MREEELQVSLPYEQCNFILGEGSPPRSAYPAVVDSAITNGLFRGFSFVLEFWLYTARKFSTFVLDPTLECDQKFFCKLLSYQIYDTVKS